MSLGKHSHFTKLTAVPKNTNKRLFGASLNIFVLGLSHKNRTATMHRETIVYKTIALEPKVEKLSSVTGQTRGFAPTKDNGTLVRKTFGA